MSMAPPSGGEGDEAALVEAGKRGDPDALAGLAERYEGVVYRFAMRMCRNVEDAKEILQDTFLTALRALGDFRGESRFSTWLYRIASNACLKRRTRAAADRELPLEEFLPAREGEGPPEIPDWSENPEAVSLKGEVAGRLEAAIDRLPRDYKIVLVLRDVEGLSNEEVATALDLTVGAVKSRLHRARLFMRRELSGYFEGR